MLRTQHFCATPNCGKRASRGCVRCGADCCRKHGKLYPVELGHFPPTLPLHMKEEMEAHHATFAKVVLCPPCLQIVTAERVNGQGNIT